MFFTVMRLQRPDDSYMDIGKDSGEVGTFSVMEIVLRIYYRQVFAHDDNTQG
jgi:hypothetical protein